MVPFTGDVALHEPTIVALHEPIIEFRQFFSDYQSLCIQDSYCGNFSRSELHIRSCFCWCLLCGYKFGVARAFFKMVHSAPCRYWLEEQTTLTEIYAWWAQMLPITKRLLLGKHHSSRWTTGLSATCLWVSKAWVTFRIHPLLNCVTRYFYCELAILSLLHRFSPGPEIVSLFSVQGTLLWQRGSVTTVEINSRWITFFTSMYYVCIACRWSTFRLRSSMTSGCSTGTTVVTAGGGGFNFVAVISQVNAHGAILAIEILNHGEGFILMPSVAVNDPECMCNFEVKWLLACKMCECKRFKVFVDLICSCAGGWYTRRHGSLFEA